MNRNKVSRPNQELCFTQGGRPVECVRELLNGTYLHVERSTSKVTPFPMSLAPMCSASDLDIALELEQSGVWCMVYGGGVVYACSTLVWSLQLGLAMTL